jgi:hypothetical protein
MGAADGGLAPEPMKVVDAHVHLWDPGRLRYIWLDGTHLDRLIDASTLRAASETVTNFVVVQADCADTQGLAEVEWLVEQSAQLPGLRGIVAFAPLERGADVRDHLRALRAIPLVVGVRRLIEGERPGFAVASRFLDGVAALADFEFTFDVCVRSSQLGEVIELIRRTPDVQFVLDLEDERRAVLAGTAERVYHLCRPPENLDHHRPGLSPITSRGLLKNYHRLGSRTAAGPSISSSTFAVQLQVEAAAEPDAATSSTSLPETRSCR